MLPTHSSQHSLIGLKKLGLTALVSAWMLSCSSGSSQKESPQEKAERTDKPSVKKSTTKPKAKSGAKAKGEEDRDTELDDDSKPGKDPPTDPSPGKEVEASLTGEAYFKATVEPLLRSSCRSCHTDPKQTSGVAGPLTIYTYSSLRTFLINGTSSKSNALISKVQGMPNHAGGNQCKSGVDQSPCKEIVAWYSIEQGGGPSSSPEPGGKIGRVIEVTPGGRVFGWAVNPKNPGEQVMIKAYIGGPKGQGVDGGTAQAFVNGNDEDTPGNHAFILELPAQHRNGKPNTVVIYAVIDGVETILNPEPLSFTAWAPTAAGQAYFSSTVQPALSGCNGCHNGKGYESYYGNLFAEPPNKGGSAMNNTLINKTAGINGVSHSGGRSCGGTATGAPCNLLQTWWQMEFGTAP